MDPIPLTDTPLPPKQKEPQHSESIVTWYLQLLNSRLGPLNFFAGNMIVSGGFVLIMIISTVYGSNFIAISNSPIVVLLLWLIQMPLYVRRLHDIDQSGWWTVGFAAVNLIPFQFIGLITLPFYLFLLLKKGNPNPNKYGPPPNLNYDIKLILGLNT